MLKLYDFFCNKCKINFENMINEKNSFSPCPLCGMACEKIPGGKGQLKFKKGKKIIDRARIHSDKTLPGTRRL
jgi:nitrous oxide reductase accessory protein NosL